MSSVTKFKNGRKILSILMGLILSVCMVFSMIIQTSAVTKASNSVDEVKNSVLQVRMLYQPDKNGPTLISSGTCFLINSTTAISCAHIFEADSEFMDAAHDMFGNNHKFDEKNIKGYEILVNGGVSVSATLKKVNSNADYSILKLDETVARPTVKIGRSSDLSVTQQIYTLGYPDVISSLNDSITYTTDRITITDSIIANISTTGGVNYINHNAVLSEGNSGGPVVDENGNVVGINLYSPDGKYFMAAAIDQVVALLDDLDIEYTRSTDGNSEVEQDTTEAEPETESATEKETIAPATEATELQAENTEETTPMDTTKLIIIIVIAVLVVVVIVVVILIIMNSKKKSAEKVGTPQRGGTVIPGPAVPPQGVARPSQPPYAQPYNRTSAPSYPSATVPSNEGAGETSILNDGAGETTVLGNQSNGFTIIRKRNNEKININKPEFVIGKERRRVDYCISDNNSISRVHAKIKVRAGRCYIADLGSTNCTYVNGSKLSPNQEVILSKGDQIKFSDEEFEFLG